MRFASLALAWSVLALLLALRAAPPLILSALAYLGGLGLIALAYTLFRRTEELAEKLREQGERSRREIEELSAGLGEWIWECDAEGRLSHCGPAVTSVLGFGAEVVCGSPIADLAIPDDAGRARSQVRAAMSTGQAFQALDLWCLTRQGERVCVRFEGAAIRDEKGSVRGLRGVARDVTRQREVESELAKSTAQLEAARAETRRLAGRAGAANRTQSDFVARMSHELRTPLNGMLGLTEELRESSLTAAQLSCVDELAESSTRLSRLVGDILDFAKLEAGQALLAVAPFEIEEIVRDVVSEHRPRAASKGLAFSLDLGDELPPRLRGDASRVAQMMGHVIGNAVKFTDQGRVEVKLRALEGEGDTLRVLFAVQDTGPGIPVEMQRRILEPFGVLDASVSRRQEGSGLGLSLVARLAEAMGGRLGIESNPGEGTRIWFTLRFGAVAQEVERVAETDAREQLRVLVVDDNRINARVAAKAVERIGHVALTTLSGAEALDAMRDENVDLVLTDVQMPEMDGVELARRIRAGEAGPSSVPIVALTAHGTRDDRDRCLAAGMNIYLVKPLDIEALRAAISRLVKVPTIV